MLSPFEVSPVHTSAFSAEGALKVSIKVTVAMGPYGPSARIKKLVILLAMVNRNSTSNFASSVMFFCATFFLILRHLNYFLGDAKLE